MGTVASLLADRVAFRCTSVDRLFLSGYVPGLQSEGQVVRFLLSRGFPIPSPAGLGQNHDRLDRDISRFIAERDVPLVRFAKGQNKEDTARPLLAEAASAGEERVVLVGVAQEKVSAWRGWKNGGSAGHPHFSYGRQSLFVNHHYFYAWDDQWGPVFVKLCGYAPYPMWVYCNGHEWAKRQLTHQGIGFEALDNGLRSCADPAAAHRVCARLAAGHVKSLLARWTARVPSPFTPADHANGFSYAWSIRQLEISDTAVFDRPADGRTWFNAAIRDHLDLGRPDKVRLIVNRRILNRGPNATPGTFETRIVTRDVTPTIQVHYKSSKVKAYLKEGRALRVETTINNPNDFGIRKTLNAENWQALRRCGTQTNNRFLDACGQGAPPPPDATALAQVVLPSNNDGLRAPGLRFGDPRVMALLATIAGYAHIHQGVTNRAVTESMTVLLGQPYTSRQATYDLRRLRRKGFIERIEGHHAYTVTPTGRRYAHFFTRTYNRALLPGLALINQASRPRQPAPHALTTAWRDLDTQTRHLLRQAA